MLRISLRKRLGRKADLTFQQIVMAIIALVVLVVLLIIFYNNVGNVNEVNTCSFKNGVCKNADEGCGEKGFEKYGDYEDCKKPNICCIMIG